MTGRKIFLQDLHMNFRYSAYKDKQHGAQMRSVLFVL